MKQKLFAVLLVIGAMLGASSPAKAAEVAKVNVAVASNFTAPMKLIATEFERDTGYQAQLSFGGTGQFYAQIKNGAPFDVLLSADAKTPRKLEQEGLAVLGTQWTYARGRLVLWSKEPALVDNSPAVLRSDRFEKIALANPRLAPYGAAAVEVIERLGLTQTLASRVVQGSNIGQAFQFVASGNAQLGFVALSQVFGQGKLKGGSVWIVPDDYYAPIEQDGVLLKSGQDNPAALALLAYLRTERVVEILQSFGYHQ